MANGEKVLLRDQFFNITSVEEFVYVNFRGVNRNDLTHFIYNHLSNFLEYEDLEYFRYRYPLFLVADVLEEHPIEEEAVKQAGVAKPFKAMMEYIQKSRAVLKQAMENRRAKGIVEMADLQPMFRNEEVIVKLGDTYIGGRVKSVSIHRSMFGTAVSFAMNIISCVNGRVAETVYEFKMKGFRGVIKATELPIRKVTEEEKKMLAEQGKKILKYSKPGSYLNYSGQLTQPGWWTTKTYRADGRIVIDPVSFSRVENKIWTECMENSGIEDAEKDSKEETIAPISEDSTLEDKDLWRLYPYLYGFSMSAKQWGRLSITGMSDIKWRDDAFDTLVLEEETKELIHSLVKYHGGGFTDIIEGKGGGCIFLLHGEPGLGKTASAEAVAEILHKPLYSVSVGELGTDTKELETSLRSILDVALIWDAVILLDEADIFLEARDERDIARNAMVGVFLRLLEYHNGVLFLTTNRVKNIDKAFYSRISVALHYLVAGAAKRQQIWHNLLTAAKLNPDFSKDLSDFDINGRQIKNAIRLAMTLAKSKEREVTVKDLRRAVEVSVRFSKEMKVTHASTELEEEDEDFTATASV